LSMELDTTRAPQVAGMIQQRKKRMRKEAPSFKLDAPEEFQRCESGLADLSYGLVFA
jgi:hypothetical protein